LRANRHLTVESIRYHPATREKMMKPKHFYCIAMILWSAQLGAAEPGTTTAVIPEYAESYPAYGVSESVRAGDLIYIGGIIATDMEGEVIAPYDGRKQAEVVYGRIKTILEAHGASYKNVVSETLYLTDWQRYFEGAEVRKKFYDDAGAAYPSSVGQEVVSLALPGLVMEVRMVAYVGAKKAVKP
jgi:2-iminobutanoate/2-iminopropanoate deaminase